MKIFDNRLALLERALDLRLERHGRLSGNLANVDTPGYAPKDIDFDRAIADAQAALDTDRPAPQGIAPGSYEMEGPSGSPSLDGNRVSLDGTMAALNENALKYTAASRAAGKKLALLRYVANDGLG